MTVAKRYVSVRISALAGALCVLLFVQPVLATDGRAPAPPQCTGCVNPTPIPAAAVLAVPFPLNGSGAEALGVLPSGDLIVAEGDRLSRINEAGAHHFIVPNSPNAQWRLIPDSNGAISATIGHDFIAEVDSQIVRVNEHDRIIGRVPVSGDVRWLAVDRRGTAWIWMSNAGLNGRIYAIDETSGTATLLEGTNENPLALFLGADGNVYTLASRGLLRLSVDSIARATSVSGALLQMQCSGGYAGFSDDMAAVRGVGPDGSLWASGPTVIMHRHPGGRTVCLRFHPPIRTISHPPIDIGFQIANDGSAWLSWDTSLIRVTPDDRIFQIWSTDDLSRGYAIGTHNDLWYWSLTAHALVHAEIGLARSRLMPDIGVWELPKETSEPFDVVSVGNDPIRFLVHVDPGTAYASNLVDMYTRSGDLLMVSSLPVAPDTLVHMTPGSGPWSGWLSTASRILRDDYNPHQILSVVPDAIVAMASSADHTLWIVRKAHGALQATTLVHLADAHAPKSPMIDDVQHAIPDITDLRLGADRSVYARDAKGNLYRVRVHARPVAVFHGVSQWYAVDSKGSVWFIQDGIAYHDTGEEVQTVTGINGATAIAALPNGAVWIAARSKLCDISVLSLKCYVLPEELLASALFAQPDGTIWFGTGALIARFRP